MNDVILLNKEYLFEYKEENFDNWLMKNKFFKHCLEEFNTLNEQILEDFIFNLSLLPIEVGKSYLEQIATMHKLNNEELNNLLECLVNVQNIGVNIPTYKEIFEHGLKIAVKEISPIEEIIKIREEIMFENRGMSITDKGEIVMNANIFSKYIINHRLRLIQDNVHNLYVYNRKGFYENITEQTLKKFCRDILHEAKEDIWTKTMENEYFEAILREIPIVKTLNGDVDWINLKNGLLNIKTLEFKNHSPEHYSTIQIPIEYDKEAKCEEFKKFLNDIFNGDQERISLIQELMGYSFLKDIKIQKAFIFFGKGANGKSVLAEIMKNVVGKENTSNVPLSTLNDRFGLQDLPGKLLNISTENELDKPFNTQNLKAITGGDAVTVEEKYKKARSEKLFVKLVILTNRMIETNDLSHGFLRRLVIIPFENTYLENIEEENENVKLMDKNIQEKLLGELSGILNFALDGLRRLISNDFKLTESKKCKEAIKEFLENHNPMVDFINDKIVVSFEDFTSRKEIKMKFSEWAVANGATDYTLISDKRLWELFKNELDRRNIIYKEVKVKGLRGFKGINLNEEVENEWS